METKPVPTILALTHAPRIVRPTVIPVEFIVLQEAREVISLARHWDEARKATVLCDCKQPCSTARVDYFISGLQWYAPQMWEQVVLHFTEGGWIALGAGCQKMQLEMKGIWGKWYRRNATANAPQIVEVVGKSGASHVPVDLGYALTKRLGIASDFFGKNDTPLTLGDVRGVHGKAGSLRPRTDKPRVSKGCGNCHKRRTQDAP